MTGKIKILDFTLTPEEAQSGKGVDLLISHLRPDWPKDEIRHKVFSGGQINCMMVFHRGDNKDDGIVVRIYSEKAEAVMNHDNEVMFMQLAHHQKCFPEVFAFFGNGMAYKYTPGRLLNIKEFEKPNIARTIARSLCDFHNADLKTIPVVDRRGQLSSVDTSFRFYTDMRKVVNRAPPQLTEDDNLAASYAKLGISREALLREIDRLEESLEPLDLPKTIIHYDYHQRNGVYDDKSGQLTILDLETAKQGYESFDIGGLFVEGPWRRLVPHFYDETNGEPAKYSEELKRLYAREYITRKYEIQGRDPSEVTDDVIQLQYLEHDVVETAFHLFWVVMFVVASSFHRDKPVREYMTVEWDLYQKSMAHFPDVKDQYLSQRAKVQAL